MVASVWMSPTPPWDLDTQPPDVAVFMGLAEEFQELARTKADRWYARKNPAYGGYDYFWIEPASGYRCVASFSSSTSEEIARATQRLLEWRPAVFIHIGLAMGLHDGIEIGDVVVPDVAVRYEAGRKGPADAMDFSASAGLFEEIRHLAFVNPEALQRWRTRSSSWPAETPTIRVEPLAFVRSVADLSVSLLQVNNRKFNVLSVGGAEFGLLGLTDRSLTLLIRGICDHASAEKKVALQDLLPGGLTGHAIRNAIGVFDLLMELDLLPRTSRKVATSAPTTRVPSAHPTSFRALSLTLRNIRCFPELTVDFGHSGVPTDWTLVLGNNAAGKSTLLRALALSLTPASELGSMLHADGDGWTGPDAPSGEIALTFHIDGKPYVRTLTLSSEGRSTKFDVREDATVAENFPLLAGYGAARQLQGTKELTVYSRYDSTSTLMSPNGSLQNPELAVRRVVANRDPRPLLERLDHILLLEPGSTQLSSAGLVVRGPDGETRPLAQLSDGFRGTLSWVMDFIGWQFMASESFGIPETSAIVIVDEIEQHLHPQWQRAVIARLRKQFPTVQFIVSTHAPLCVIGSTDLADEDVSLTYVERGRDADGQVWSRARSGMLPPRGQRADQVLTSYLFGLSSTRDQRIVREINELSSLLSREERSASEQERVAELQRELEPLLGSAETELEREIQRAALAAAERVIARELERLSPEERERMLHVGPLEEPET